MAEPAAATPLSQHAMHFLYHHVFLPPEVPQSDDYQPELDLLLMQIARDGLSTLKKLVSPEQHDRIEAAARMLAGMQGIHVGGDIETAQLLKAFGHFVKDGKR